MSARLTVVLPLLSRTRDALDGVYEALVRSAGRAPIPCVAIEVYKTTRRRALDMENAVVVEAKKAGLHPPEDVPRSLPLFGACPPNQNMLTFKPDAVANALRYVETVKHRIAATDKALTALFDENPEIHKHLTGLLDAIVAAGHARVGTPEASPPPGNISLLRLFYYLGGSIWPLTDADTLMRMETDVLTEEDVKALYRDAQDLANATKEIETATAEKTSFFKDKKAILILGGVSLLGATATGLAVWFTRKNENEHRRYGDAIDAEAEETLALPAHTER